MRQNLGFTLVELVTMIILIGILAVVALPRLLTQSSYSAYALQDEFISELRKAQMMALNNSDRCYRVAVTANDYQTFHYPNRNASGCTGTILRREGQQAFQGGANLSLITPSSNSFNIDFDTSGRMNLGCSGKCINVNADQILVIAIESEGYIHEG